MAERSDEDESEEESDGEDIDEAARIASALYRLDEGIDVDSKSPMPGRPAVVLLRITLCCALLKTAAPCLLASITTHGPLESALDDIQRSFFAKPSAPLGPRYALLDALEDVRRHRRALQASWPRRARQAASTKQTASAKGPGPCFRVAQGLGRGRRRVSRARLAANRARLMLQHRPVAEEPQVVEGQRRSDIEEDDSGDDDEDEAATASESESGSSSDSEESDDDGEEEESKAVNEDDAAEEEEEDDDEDEEKPPEKSFDDLAFERAFEKTMLDDAAAQRRRVIAARTRWRRRRCCGASTANHWRSRRSAGWRTSRC